MTTVILLGALGLTFISAYMFFKFGENTGNEHFVLQLLLVAMIVGGIAIAGAAGYNAANCQTMAVNSTVAGGVTTYGYDTVCNTSPVGVSDTFVRYTSYYYRIFMTYVIVYFIYRVLVAWGKLPDVFTRRGGKR